MQRKVTRQRRAIGKHLESFNRQHGQALVEQEQPLVRLLRGLLWRRLALDRGGRGRLCREKLAQELLQRLEEVFHLREQLPPLVVDGGIVQHQLALLCQALLQRLLPVPCARGTRPGGGGCTDAAGSSALALAATLPLACLPLLSALAFGALFLGGGSGLHRFGTTRGWIKQWLALVLHRLLDAPAMVPDGLDESGQAGSVHGESHRTRGAVRGRGLWGWRTLLGGRGLLVGCGRLCRPVQAGGVEVALIWRQVQG
mmetsp:Transcript_11092/g.28427  ORF Transcript_11092/g.28427 Transcript_11092/m.28427 type:complete len:256 (+) Transcript_11092:878-1645(+)